MSMAMALNNVKKCYSKVPNSCPESDGGALGLDTMGQNCFQIAISQNILKFSFNLYKNILDFVDLTCILLGILPQKRWSVNFKMSNVQNTNENISGILP